MRWNIDETTCLNFCLCCVVSVDLIGQEVWDEPAQLGCVPRSTALTANPNKPPGRVLKPPGNKPKPQWRSVKRDFGLCPAGLDTPYKHNQCTGRFYMMDLQGLSNKNLEYLRLTQPAWPLKIGHSHLWPISVICGPFQIQSHGSVAMYLGYND
jgi:hypothetical protein